MIASGLTFTGPFWAIIIFALLILVWRERELRRADPRQRFIREHRSARYRDRRGF